MQTNGKRENKSYTDGLFFGKKSGTQRQKGSWVFQHLKNFVSRTIRNFHQPVKTLYDYNCPKKPYTRIPRKVRQF